MYADSDNPAHPYSLISSIAKVPDTTLFFILKVFILFLFLHENICCSTHQKFLAETIQMCTHNICFCVEKRKLFIWIFLLSGNMQISQFMLISVHFTYAGTCKTYTVCSLEPKRSA